jgi:hypothetical protein
VELHHQHEVLLAESRRERREQDTVVADEQRDYMIIRQFLILCHIFGLIVIFSIIADGVVDTVESLLEQVRNGTLAANCKLCIERVS